MLNIIVEVLSQLQGMWRFRWHSLVLVWAMCAVGWTYSLVLPDQYSASARIFVNPETALQDLLRGLAVQTDVVGQIELMTRTLLSRQNLERVARRADLHLEVNTPAQMDEVIARLKSNVEMRAGRQKDLYSISYVDTDRERAKRVVSALMDSFVEDTRGASRIGSSAAQEFLDQQIAEYEQRLALAEKRVADFKKQNMGLMPGNNRDYYSRLESAQAEARAAATEVDILNEKKAELERQISGEVPSFGLAPPSPVQQQTFNDPVLNNYRERLNDLLLQYTDKHPDVIALRETISQLEQRLAAQQPPPGTQPVAPQAAETNPVYQNVKIALSEINVQLVEARGRLREKRKQIDELKRLADAVPEVEAQLQTLNRDYEITKKRYEALLERREVAKLTEDAELSKEDGQFRIVDPPSVGSDPVFPRREVLISVSLLVALGAGMALAFLLNQLKPVFNNKTILESICGYPVLGSVERVWTASERRRLKTKTFSFLAVLSLLFVIFGVTLLFHRPTAALAHTLMAGIV